MSLMNGYRICNCVYESTCHGIEMIKSPSGVEYAIGGTNHPDRWKHCPWCGGSIPDVDEGPLPMGHIKCECGCVFNKKEWHGICPECAKKNI